jgi:hypothetical protein
MKVNFSAVLMGLPNSKGERKALQIMTRPGIVSNDGKYVLEAPTMEDLTLRDLVLDKLQTQPEQRDTENMGKLFALCVRIAQGGEVEISVAERNKIVEKLAKLASLAEFGAADAILNPQPAEVKEEKTA